MLVATLLVDGGVEMGRRGRKRQLDVETEYWRLLKSYDFCNRYSHGEGSESVDVLDARAVQGQIRRCMELREPRTASTSTGRVRRPTSTRVIHC